MKQKWLVLSSILCGLTAPYFTVRQHEESKGSGEEDWLNNAGIVIPSVKASHSRESYTESPVASETENRRRTHSLMTELHIEINI